jgi:uncharacterized lipoprotein YmbA
MTMGLRHRGAAALLLLAAGQVAGCGSTPPARFYTLSSLAAPGATERSPAGAPRKVVGIGPIALARYLDHPGITTRTGANTVNRSELDLWGGSLGDEITRVLVENVGRLLPDGTYLVLPWVDASAVDCGVQVNITRFDGPLEGPVALNASWLVSGKERSAVLASGDARITEPVRGEGYAALSDAMSRALAELSRRIVAEVR